MFLKSCFDSIYFFSRLRLNIAHPCDILFPVLKMFFIISDIFLLSKNWSAFLLNMPRLFWKCYCLFIKRLERQKDIKWKRILLYSDCLKITKFPQSVNNKKNIYNKLVSQKLQTGMEILTANALKIKNNFTTILH